MPAVITAGAGIQTRDRIKNIYPCNIIHEISLGYCEPNGVQGESIVQYGINHPEDPGGYLDLSGLRYSINQDLIVTQQIL